MRILFVEDNQTFSSHIAPILEAIPDVEAVDVAANRFSASEALTANHYDLIVLDLSIPASDADLDIDPAHGQSVFHNARASNPGIPIYILTGSEPDDFSRRLARFGNSLDVFGGGEVPTVDYYVKEEADKLIESVIELAANVAKTDALAIDTRGRELALTAPMKRILKVLVRRLGGVSCTVLPLSGGLSDARVLHVTVKNERGQILARSAGKFGSGSAIEHEVRAYELHVKRLKTGAFPPVLSVVDKGVWGYAAIFYTLAEDHERTFFGVAAAEAPLLPTVIGHVRGQLDRWIEAAEHEEVTVRVARRGVLDDVEVDRLVKDFHLERHAQVDELVFRARLATVHGDLHGGNILVDARGSPILIDFGEVGTKCSPLDPLTLELSLIFHPDAVEAGISVVLRDRIDSWCDIEAYARGDLGAAVRRLREWAYDVAAGDAEVLAVAYIYALRQLKYPTVPPEVTLRLINLLTDRLLA